MTNKEFYSLYPKAKKEPNKETFAENVKIPEASKIWNLAHLDARELVELTGLTQKEFGEKYFLKLNTIWSWVSNCPGRKRNIPDVVKLLILKDIGILDDILN